ncbi:MAG: hypothetical protein ACKOW3_02820 [Hyphomicrobium sp.]
MLSHRKVIEKSTAVQNTTIDLSDVPYVSIRELATALKVLGDETAALQRAKEWSDTDFRRVEQYFWQRCGRDRHRKIASLVRLRCLIDVCKARTLQNLISLYGIEAVMPIIETATTMRLNTSVGFSPTKISYSALLLLKRNLNRSFVAKAAA